jgi:hypothetical protein
MMVLEVNALGSAIHVYGVTAGGLSVRAEVSHCWPFLYCRPTVTLSDGSRRDIREDDLPALRRALEEELISSRAAKQLAKAAPQQPAAAAGGAAAASVSAALKKGGKGSGPAATAAGKKGAGGAAAAAASFFKAKPAASKATAIDVDEEDEELGVEEGEAAEEDAFEEEEEEGEDETLSAATGRPRSCVIAMKLVQKRSLMYYRGPDISTFVQVWLASPTLLTPAHQALSKKLKVVAAASATADSGANSIKICPTCTLHNSATRSTCSACDSSLSAVAAASDSAAAAGGAAGTSSSSIASFSSVGELYGTNIEHYMRFMVLANIVGGGWADLRAPHYELVAPEHKRTRCALELRCKWSDDPALQPIVGLATDMQSLASASIAPLRVLSFDIQPASKGKDVTSDPARDPVLAIANQAVWFPRQIDANTGLEVPPVRVLFLLRSAVGAGLPAALLAGKESQVTASSGGSSKLPPGVEVVWCSSEADLLRRWRDFFLAIDADIVTGYDIAERDIPFLLARAERYERTGGKADAADVVDSARSPPPAAKRSKKSPAASPAASSSSLSSSLTTAERATAADFSNWAFLGRDGRVRSELSNVQTYSSGWVRSKKRMSTTSNQASAYFKMEGRLFFDCQRIIQTQHSLRTYSLQECAHEFLQRTEEFLDDSILNGLLQQASAPLPKEERTSSSSGGGRTLNNALDRSAKPPAAVTASPASFSPAGGAAAASSAAASAPTARKMTAKDRKRRRDVEYEDLSSSPSPSPEAASSAAAAVPAAVASVDADAIAAIPVVPSLAHFDSPLRSFTRYASYALRQAELPLLLMDALTVVVQSMELSRTTGINIKDVWTRGQMIRTWSLLLRHCHSSEERYVVPSQRDNSQMQTMTSGPWIFDCIALGTTGLHQDPVATLDFNSLYPSIMIGPFAFSSFFLGSTRSTPE